MQVPYYSELERIRRFFQEEVKDFPFNKCQHSARFLREVIGLEEVAGDYNYQILGETFTSSHCWSYDPKLRLYIDLTMDQFSKSHRKIEILPLNTPFISKIGEDTDACRSFSTEGFTSLNLGNLIQLYRESVLKATKAA